MKHTQEIIDNLLVTEKGTGLSVQNKYVFKVSTAANRLEIKKAVQDHFKVHVTSINTMVCKGKLKRERSMQYGRTARWKKAIVTLQAGEAINLQ